MKPTESLLSPCGARLAWEEMVARESSERATSETACQPRSLDVATCSAPRRPLHRDGFTRGFVCAVAQLVQMHGYGTEAKDLLKVVGKLDHILKHADEEDIATLRDAGLIPQNSKDEPRRP